MAFNENADENLVLGSPGASPAAERRSDWRLVADGVWWRIGEQSSELRRRFGELKPKPNKIDYVFNSGSKIGSKPKRIPKPKPRCLSGCPWSTKTLNR